MKSYGYKNEEECVEGYYNMIWWILLALSPIYLLLQCYLGLVIWTHWQNAGLKKSEGGCKPEGENVPIAQHMDIED